MPDDQDIKTTGGKIHRDAGALLAWFISRDMTETIYVVAVIGYLLSQLFRQIEDEQGRQSEFDSFVDVLRETSGLKNKKG